MSTLLAMVTLIFGLNTRPFSQKSFCLLVIVYIEARIFFLSSFLPPFSGTALDPLLFFLLPISW